MSDTERARDPKAVVSAFFKLAFVDRSVRSAYESFVSEDYVQHNPKAKNGREAALLYLEPLYASQPERRATVHRVICEDDLVVIHSWIQRDASDPGAAHIDIFRVTDGWITEHWDVIEPLSDLSGAQDRF